MQFLSDNSSAIHRLVLERLARVPLGSDQPYGADRETKALQDILRDIFEKPDAVAVPVATGTAANGLILATLSPPWGAVLCHEIAHIQRDECACVEFLGHGLKLLPCGGEDGKIAPERMAHVLAQHNEGTLHHSQPKIVSLTQATEYGTVYTARDIAQIYGLAQERGMALHLDGARFANALDVLECTPAEASWKIGVRALSLGVTKNGGGLCDVALFFDPADAEKFRWLYKKSGHLLSKMRYFSAGLRALFEEGLWLQNARHANRSAARLAQWIAETPGCRLAVPQQTNAVFAHLPPPLWEGLKQQGLEAYPWPNLGPEAVRLVTSWNTEAQTIETFGQTLRRLAQALSPRGSANPAANRYRDPAP